MGGFKGAIKSMFQRGKWKILRGDKVLITAGKDRGETGTVTKVIRDEKRPRVIVEGLNLVGARISFICGLLAADA
jgi:ribosomal protein S4E